MTNNAERCEALKTMVDKEYKKDLPVLKEALEKLRTEFSNLDSETNWIELRIEPLLEHLESLRRLLQSKEFLQEFSRLRKGVVLFDSDLVYFKTNIKGLKEILQSEKGTSASKES